MRLIPLLFILWCSTASANPLVLLSGSPPAAGGLPSYVVNEGFEAGTEPSGWGHGGTPNYNYTAAPLAGSKSLELTSTTGQAWTNTLTLADTYYMTMLYKTVTLPASDSKIVEVYGDAGSNTLIGSLSVKSSGAIIAHAASDSTSAAGVIVANTPIYIKIQSIKGTGANAILTVWTSSDGTTWTQQGSSTDGVTTAQPSQFVFESTTGTIKSYFDVIKVLSTDITDARTGH